MSVNESEMRRDIKAILESLNGNGKAGLKTRIALADEKLNTIEKTLRLHWWLISVQILAVLGIAYSIFEKAVIK